jgi:hypothetical protein
VLDLEIYLSNRKNVTMSLDDDMNRYWYQDNRLIAKKVMQGGVWSYFIINHEAEIININKVERIGA